MDKLIDLKRAAEDLKKLDVPIRERPPRYPYGIGITLEDEELKKLNKSISDFKVGDDIDVTAKAKVTGTSQSDEEMGRTRRSVSLQLRKMKLG